MTDRIAELEATAREGIWPSPDVSDVECEKALSAVTELGEIARRQEAALTEAWDLLQEFLDAWFEWAGDETEPLDRAASRAMTLLGTVIALVSAPEDETKP